MKELKDLTAEDFLEPWHDWNGEGNYVDGVKGGAIDFAKYHVKQALIEASKLQQLKYIQGETGYLTKEDWENVYSADMIK